MFVMSKKDNGDVKVGGIHSIVVQISLLNIGMLIAFLIVMVMIMTSMNTSTSTSVEMFDSMMNLTTHDAKLKTDIMSLYDQVTGYIASGSAETQEALLPQIEVAKSTIAEDISQLTTDFAAYSNEDAAAQLQEIEAQYDRMCSFIDKAIEKCDAGDQENAYAILFDKAEIQKVAIIHSTEILDEAIEENSSNTKANMTYLLKRGNIIAAIGIGIFILLIIFNFLMTYRSVVARIKSMSAEVNDIIELVRLGSHSELFGN